MNAELEAKVGIFWLLLDGKITVDATPVSQAERCGRFRIHSPGHMDVWERRKHAKSIPFDIEYDELPRGRVAYDVVTERFTILADRCILADKALIASVYRLFALPTNTIEDRDPHYRCPHCLWGSSLDED